jgi:RNase adaptor protein for sRNA GlmZ degradation
MPELPVPELDVTIITGMSGAGGSAAALALKHISQPTTLQNIADTLRCL